MKRNKKCGSDIGVAFVTFSAGVVIVCLCPLKWIVVLTAVMLVAAGIILMKR